MRTSGGRVASTWPGCVCPSSVPEASHPSTWQGAGGTGHWCGAGMVPCQHLTRPCSPRPSLGGVLVPKCLRAVVTGTERKDFSTPRSMGGEKPETELNALFRKRSVPGVHLAIPCRQSTRVCGFGQVLKVMKYSEVSIQQGPRKWILLNEN